MSVFGKMDAATIPSNAFFIGKGEYSAEVTAAGYKDNKDGQRQLVIEYTINDVDSQYLDSKASHRFTLVDSEMTQEAFEMLPAEEKKNIRRTNSSIKKTLCGADGNDKHKGLGVSADDLNDNWDPAVLVGTKIRMGISNWGTDGVNVQWVNLQD